MSKEFDYIKNEFGSHQQNQENQRSLELTNLRQRIERDKKILEQSGVIELFKEIRDGKLVILHNNTRRIEKFFGGERLERLPDTPARIVLSENNIDQNYLFGNTLSNKNKETVSVLLDFNEFNSGEMNAYKTFSEVKILVSQGKLNLVLPNNGHTSPYDDSNIFEIKEGELSSTIANALKNPRVFKDK